MSFLIAPGSDFNGAFDIRVGIENARGFEGVHDAKRPIEPARVVLAFEMRPGQQPGPGFRTGAQHIADAVDRSGQPGLGQPLRQPLQRAQMRLGEGRLVNPGFVGADATQRSEIRKDPGAIGLKAMVRHDLFYFQCGEVCKPATSAFKADVFRSQTAPDRAMVETRSSTVSRLLGSSGNPPLAVGTPGSNGGVGPPRCVYGR